MEEFNSTLRELTIRLWSNLIHSLTTKRSIIYPHVHCSVRMLMKKTSSTNAIFASPRVFAVIDESQYIHETCLPRINETQVVGTQTAVPPFSTKMTRVPGANHLAVGNGGKLEYGQTFWSSKPRGGWPKFRYLAFSWSGYSLKYFKSEELSCSTLYNRVR